MGREKTSKTAGEHEIGKKAETPADGILETRLNKKDPRLTRLRHEAEKRLKAQIDQVVMDKLCQGEIKTLVHELCTYQIALEIQNEELRQAQWDLEQSRHKFSDLYDFAPVGYFSLTSKGIILSANLTGAAMLGVPRGELIDKPFLLFIDEKDRDLFYLHCRKLEREDLVQSCELRLKNDDGTIRYVRLEGKADRHGNGEAPALLITMSDITAYRQAEEKLRESEARFRRMAETSADIIFQIEPQGMIRYCSPAALLYGYRPEQVIGQPFAKYLPSDDLDKAMDALQRLNSGEKIKLFEIRMLRADGTTADLEVNATPIVTDGVVTGIQGIARDITVRKRAENEINKLNRELRESVFQLATTNMELEAYSTSVSHDLRAPLRSVEGFSRALLEDYGDTLEAGARDYLERIVKGADRMSRLIDDLLDLSRVVMSDMQRDRVNLSRLAERVAFALKESEPERRVEFRIVPDIIAEGDAHLLSVVLDNLLGNAFKFTGRQPEALIEFGVNEEEGKREFYVRDNGAGLDMTHVKRLFVPFQRLHSESDFPGDGIGLAIVKRIIQRHGGTIRIEGEQGKGATVYFTLGTA